MQRKTFTNRDLLAWVNAVADADYSYIQDLKDGIAYCQVVDALFPGKMPLHRLVFDVKRPDDCTANFRLLADVLTRCNSGRTLQIEPLAHGKLADHIEFMLWLQEFAHRSNPANLPTYNAYARRADAAQKSHKIRSLKGPVKLPVHLVPNRTDLLEPALPGVHAPRKTAAESVVIAPGDERFNSPRVPSPRRQPPPAQAAPQVPRLHIHGSPTTASPAPSSARTRNSTQPQQRPATAPAAAAAQRHARADVAAVIEETERVLGNAMRRLLERTATMMRLRDERDFYFDKLRSIEAMCETQAEVPHKAEVLHILHSGPPEFEREGV
eukprot:TRINITY_DN10211_c0_g1_i1.p1 TRINITY_DN10211_c0_g1~~TRINITY_DN10211_c0_g1_i1.p1  ORF type:complete len:325 (-),score=74.20 TRINITY_DN10211_c0_g1_i1:153-1127(-)